MEKFAKTMTKKLTLAPIRSIAKGVLWGFLLLPFAGMLFFASLVARLFYSPIVIIIPIILVFAISIYAISTHLKSAQRWNFVGIGAVLGILSNFGIIALVSLENYLALIAALGASVFFPPLFPVFALTYRLYITPILTIPTLILAVEAIIYFKKKTAKTPLNNSIPK